MLKIIFIFIYILRCTEIISCCFACVRIDRFPIFLIATDRLAAVNAEILNPSDITHDEVIGKIIYLKMR